VVHPNDQTMQNTTMFLMFCSKAAMSSPVTLTSSLSTYLYKKQLILRKRDCSKFWLMVVIISLQFLLMKSINGYATFLTKSEMCYWISLLSPTFSGRVRFQV
jgi:hypothetical protein